MLSFTLSCLLLSAPQAQEAPTPDADNLQHWLEQIRPSPAEELYRQIGWRNALAPAIEEAQQLGRPILLWTMNGHPLGCT